MTRFALLLLLPAVALSAPVPKVKGEGKLLVSTDDGKVTLMNPDGSDPKVVAEAGEKEQLLLARLSHDGKQVVYAVSTQTKGTPDAVRVKSVAGGESTELCKVKWVGRLFWSKDGKTVYGCGIDEAIQKPGVPNYECYVSWRLEAATGKRTELDMTGEYQPFGLTPAGDELLCLRQYGRRQIHPGTSAANIETVKTGPDKFAPEVLIPADVDAGGMAALPDGERWVVHTRDGKLGTYSAKAGVKEWDAFPAYSTLRVTVGPDGKRVAVMSQDNNAGSKPGKVVLTGLDGGDLKTVWEPKARIVDLDWR
jgi:hypothetical protein